MKSDRLKPLVFSLKDMAYVDEPAVEKNFQNPHGHAVYKATEVDAAIAELKNEINRKEAVGKRWFERCMEARAENIQLKKENKRLKEARPDLPPVQPGTSPQKWMAATNPPQNMREVLICVPIQGRLAVCLGHFNYTKKQWYLHDRYDPTEVAYWSEKPLPPEKR